MTMTDDAPGVELDVPNATIGDYHEARGALMNAVTDFIDWEALHNGEPNAIATPGRIILELIRSLPR
jgi:hypothetical protein